VTSIPEAGDLVWLRFDQQAGHEQAGRRPALVLSPRAYHERTPFAIVCPITSNTAPYPFKVALPENAPIQGAILADQVKSVDRNARNLKVAGHVTADALADVRAKLAALIDLDR
jgi:mRNA interferase MazF